MYSPKNRSRRSSSTRDGMRRTQSGFARTLMNSRFTTTFSALPTRLAFALLVASLGYAATPAEISRWQREAHEITIVRDDWGIAHIYGKTDADAVFGSEFAQAEDDFNRIETNYLNAMGRLAEAEG